MNDQKQLIKAITDLTKAVDRNTKAIKENAEIGKVDINTVESDASDDLCGNTTLGSIEPYRWNNGDVAYFKPEEILTTDGLGNTHTYKKGVGGILYSGNKDIGETQFVSSGQITLTQEDQEKLFDSLKDKGKKFK